MNLKRYNIRVYALIIHYGKILVTDEIRGGVQMTKFPGGGNEWGEGLLETLNRECVEELNREVISAEHFYTTDFFVASAFRKEDQMISVYYKTVLADVEKIKIVEKEFDFEEKMEGAQVFRWIDLKALSPAQFTFPIDKKVVEMLLK